jgi:hypothetical protein
MRRTAAGRPQLGLGDHRVGQLLLRDDVDDRETAAGAAPAPARRKTMLCRLTPPMAASPIGKISICRFQNSPPDLRSRFSCSNQESPA